MNMDCQKQAMHPKNVIFAGDSAAQSEGRVKKTCICMTQCTGSTRNRAWQDGSSLFAWALFYYKYPSDCALSHEEQPRVAVSRITKVQLADHLHLQQTTTARVGTE